MPHIQYRRLSYCSDIKWWSYSMLNGWISTAVKVIALQFLLLLSHKLVTVQSELMRELQQTQQQTFISQNLLNADYFIPLCVFVCVSGRAQPSLCFMGPLLLWSTTTSTMLLWSCRARCIMFQLSAAVQLPWCSANVYDCMFIFVQHI